MKVVVELEDFDALPVADTLDRAAMIERHNGRMPPPAWETVAASLRLTVAVARLHASEFGSQHRQDPEDRETFFTVDEGCRALGIVSRALTRRCALGQVPGARRLDPSKKTSPWLIPATYVAEQRTA